MTLRAFEHHTSTLIDRDSGSSGTRSSIQPPNGTVGGREVVIRRAQGVLSEPPPAGTNVIIVGHGNLMWAATGAYAGEGGSAIYVSQPESDQGFELVARLSPDDWTELANRFAGD